MLNHMLKEEVSNKLIQYMSEMVGLGRIVEIGTGWGESSSFFSKLKPNWTIYTIDSFGIYGDGRIYQSWDHDQVKKILSDLGPNVIQVLGNSSKIPWEMPIRVLFIDGDHTENGCMADFINYSKHVVQGGLIIFDDYHQENNPNNGVKAVVDKIILNERFKIEYSGNYCAIVRKLY